MRVVLDGRYPPERYPGIARYVEVVTEGMAALPWGPDVTLLGAGPPVRSWVEQWRLPAAALRARPDLWHAPYVVFPYAVPVPVVATLFDVIGTRPGAGRNRRAVEAAARVALRRARLVVTASEAAARQIRRAFPACGGKLRVVPGAVAARFRPQTEAARRAVTERLGLPSRYLLYVGTDRPHKNLAGLVAAVARYRAASGDDMLLVVAGAQDGRGVEGVRFLGWVPDDDLPALYAGAQLFVSASFEEGFGFPVLEAMACGAAVVCSGTPALAELTGDAAVRFPPGDEAAIAAAIAEGLERRPELARRGLGRAAAYPASRTAERTAEVYREALDQPSRWRYHP